MTDTYEVHAEIDNTDRFIGTFTNVVAREDGLALYRDDGIAGFIQYNRSPLAMPADGSEENEDGGTDAMNTADGTEAVA